MNKENCALKLVDEIILYYDARSKKHQMPNKSLISNIKSTQFGRVKTATLFSYRLKRNNNEVWQQDIKIKIPRTVNIHARSKKYTHVRIYAIIFD